MTIPDPAPIIHLMEAFRHSKTMFAGVSLGLFDLLEKAPRTNTEVAERLGTNPVATRQLLESCVSLGLLDNDSGAFRNTPVASVYLTKSSDRSLAGYLLYSDRALYPMWAHLEDAVREGTPRWHQTFGTPGPIFDQFFSTPEATRTYMMAMHGLGVSCSPAIVRAFDLSGFHRIADLGGATGHLATAACEAWPQMSGVVFDMEKIVPFAREFTAKSPAAARLTAQAGDFFIDELPDADLFSMGRILHDWPEEKIHRLLDRVFARLPAGGGILLAEKLIEEDRRGPLGAMMQSLNMLVCAEGRERSLSEYTELLHAAGFDQVQGKHIGLYLDAVFAVKGHGHGSQD